MKEREEKMSFYELVLQHSAGCIGVFYHDTCKRP